MFVVVVVVGGGGGVVAKSDVLLQWEDLSRGW